jgi:hypothetical protein
MPSPQYPQNRPPFFAQKIIRAMVKSRLRSPILPASKARNRILKVMLLAGRAQGWPQLDETWPTVKGLL